MHAEQDDNEVVADDALPHAQREQRETVRSQQKRVGGMTIGAEEEILDQDLDVLNLSNEVDESTPSSTGDQPSGQEVGKDAASPAANHGTANAKDPKMTKKHKIKNDPIHMFGLFTPPALRQAQTSFVAVVEGAVPNLIELDSAMKALEIEIRRTRKAATKKV